MAHYVLKYNNWQTKILDGHQKMTKMLSAVIRFALPSCSLQHGIAISKKWNIGHQVSNLIQSYFDKSYDIGHCYYILQMEAEVAMVTLKKT